MKHLIIYILISIFSVNIMAQKKVNYLIATENKNLTLIFPSSIKQATVGNVNFNFVYNTNNKSNLGILKGVPGPESNLLVITSDGNIYSFILNYKKNITELTSFVKSTDAIGNLNGQIVISKSETQNKIENYNNDIVTVTPSDKNQTFANGVIENDFYENTENFESDTVTVVKNKNHLYYTDKKTFLKRKAAIGLSKPSYYKKYFTISENVFLHLKDITFNNNEIYFYFLIENKGVLDYDVNFINLYLTSSNKKKRSSSQKIKYDPIYTYYLPKKIKSFKSAEFVMIYNKFSINKKKSVIVEVNEKKGERNLQLEILSKTINNPNLN